MILTRCTMIRLAGVAMVLLTAGCGEPTIPPEEAFDPASLQGEVDETLPPELKKKQEAVYRVFDVLLQGVGVEFLSDALPEIRFEETPETFHPPGTVSLESWAFDGKPTGNDVPVVMHFTLDTSGGETKEEKRVYTVTGSGGRMVIRRKP
jgi:hypothetical protein